MSIKAETSFSLKDQLFNANTVAILATNIAQVDGTFAADDFQREAMRRFAELELKARIQWLVECLANYLPGDFIAAKDILLKALPAPLDPALNDDDFGQFIWIVPGEYVAKFGCTPEYLQISLNFLREATMRFSSENAIRGFLSEYTQETMGFMRKCATDNNYHVRRLASEGTRPFLPWSPRVNLPLADIVGLLDLLHADQARYVTRSVANSLNDLAKIDAALVVETLTRWRDLAVQDVRELEWMTTHALRTLLKAADPAALVLTGYPVKPKFSVSGIKITERVVLHQHFNWRCTITSKSTQKLKIVLRIYFLKANGSHSVKVFAVKDASVACGERIAIDKRLPFKPITTRVLYPGMHYAELVVNGVRRGKRPFELLA